MKISLFTVRERVSNSAHDGSKLLAAPRRLLLASSRLASYLSRPGEPKSSGCSAHPNQSGGFAWFCCWHACRLRLPRLRLYTAGTHRRDAATRPSQRSALIRVRACTARVRAAGPDPLTCLRQRASQAGISTPCRQVSLHPRFKPRANRGSRGKSQAELRPFRESCETLPRTRLSAP